MRNNKVLFIATLCCAFSTLSSAQQNVLNYIKVYFNQPVDNSFSNDGVNAIRVHDAIMDTIVAYINRAKYTIDIAQYDYTASSGDTMSKIATAINNAYARNVKIRWICDGSSPNSGLSLLNSDIPTLKSPDGGSCYINSSGIMHNKFVVIDEYDSLSAWVSTGSEDWNIWMNDFDYNNLIFLQSKSLAKAYTNEFNIMWGDTTHGAVANPTYEEFGTCKPNSGTHIFNIGGSEVELYFSPSDNVNTYVLNTINSADTDMYCSMYTFTESTYSTAFSNRNYAGVYTSSVIDQYSNYSGNSAYTTMSSLPNFTEYTGSQIYHDKFLVVDPSDACSDPMTLTGSMNWSYGAYTENDENTIIIHNDTIANLYLQSHAGDYEIISGGKQLVKHTGCTIPTGVNTIATNISQVDTYPNPFSGTGTIKYTLPTEEKMTIEIYNLTGQKISTLANEEMQQAGDYTYNFTCPAAGVYLLKVQEGQQSFVKKIVRIQ